MKTYNTIKTLGLVMLTFTIINCERDLSDDAVLADFTDNPEVFIDGFSSGLEYYPYADSKQTAFSVEEEDTYSGAAAMRFDVPNVGDPEGAYAGAIFRDDNGGRNLTQYDALTFWAKASQAGVLNEVGFGQDFFGDMYAVRMQNTPLTTNWVKYIVPIPDPSKLVQSKGLFWYAEGPEDGAGYSIWVDEVKYEKLGTIAQPRPKILDGNDVVTQSFNGATIALSGLTQTFNLGSGIDQTVGAAPSYFEFNSSNTSVATVDPLGVVTIIGSGTAVITASLGGEDAQGSLTVESLGDFDPAPTPTQSPANVISIFSDTYTNVPVDFFNGYWEPYQTTESSIFAINNDQIINYTDFNFVGNQFANPTINGTDMSAIHFDVFVPDGTVSPQLKIILRDFGANGGDGGGDDTNLEMTFSGASLVPGQWNSLEMSLDGMVNKDRLGLLIYENLGSDLTNFYLDNVYLYRVQTTPTVAAPTPTEDEANVISIFSDAYTDVAGTDFNPNWGQATVVTQEPIAGNNTLVYSGLNYQGTQLSGSIDVSSKTHLHIDYYTGNSSALNIFLISPGPVETPYVLTVPTNDEWIGVDIPLSEFSPVDLMNVFQLKFDGNGDIYLDNIYFY
jgi:hypothetical protein